MADEIRIPRKVFVSMVSLLTSAYPNPEEDNPPGPWDPVIRRALARIRFGPQPDPWVLAGLNPQPLPPRAAIAAALAQEVVDSIASIQLLAEQLPREGQNAASSHLLRFLDDCGNGRIPFPWPWPWPPRRKENVIGPMELVVIGAHLANAARGFADSRLGKELEEGGAKLIEMGVSQMG